MTIIEDQYEKYIKDGFHHFHTTMNSIWFEDELLFGNYRLHVLSAPKTFVKNVLTLMGEDILTLSVKFSISLYEYTIYERFNDEYGGQAWNKFMKFITYRIVLLNDFHKLYLLKRFRWSPEDLSNLDESIKRKLLEEAQIHRGPPMNLIQ